MSTKEKHRKRSHRSERQKRSAFGNMTRSAQRRMYGAAYGGPSTPLILRLRSFKQKILEARQKKAEEKEKEA